MLNSNANTTNLVRFHLQCLNYMKRKLTLINYLKLSIFSVTFQEHIKFYF